MPVKRIPDFNKEIDARINEKVLGQAREVTVGNEYATIQDAINGAKFLIPGDYVINIPAGTHTENVTIQGKLIDNGYSITLKGETSAVASGTVTSGTAGSGANHGTVTVDSAGWTVNEFQHKFIEFTTGDLEGTKRLIDSNTADTISIVGEFASAPAAGDTFDVVENVSVIDGIIDLKAIQGVQFWYLQAKRFQLAEFASAIAGYVNITTTSAQAHGVYMYKTCNIDLRDTIIDVRESASGLVANRSYAIVKRSKVLGDSGAQAGIQATDGNVQLQFGNIIDGFSGSGKAGIQSMLNSVSSCASATNVDHIVRNCYYGLNIASGAKVFPASYFSYSGNTVDENVDSSTYGVLM